MLHYKLVSIVGLLLAFIMVSAILASLDILSEDKDRNQAQEIIWGRSAYETAPRDPYTIISAEIEDDIMKVEVSFGGGCKSHDFALIVLEGFGESIPVAVAALLSHNANNDLCQAWITKEIRFDLSSLKKEWQKTYKQGSGAIRILLNSEGELPSLEILYEFQEESFFDIP